MECDLLTQLKEQFPGLHISAGESLREHTSFRIGGNAAWMLFPANIAELAGCVSLLDGKYRLLGAGTNVLAPDEGLQEPVICLKEHMNSIRLLSDTTLEAEAGAPLSRVAVFARDHGLTGLEFAHGIPGTVGGGVYMNAGAYGGEIRQVVTKVTVLRNGKQETVLCDDDTFSYRDSLFQQEDLIVVKAEFSLQRGDREKISETMRTLIEKRKHSQPLEMPSAGSAFKRPVGGYAAALIEEAGLKGFTVGGAQVSQKHSGFVVNLGSATAQDVKTLLAEVQKKVEQHSGIRLEPEVRIW